MAIHLFLILPMCTSIFCITYMFVNWKRVNRTQRTALWIYVTTFLIFLGRNAMTGGFFSPTIDVIYTVSLLLVYPSAYRTVVMIRRGRLNTWQRLFIFGPATLFGAAMMIEYAIMDRASIDEIVRLYSHRINEVTTAAASQVVSIHNAATVLFITLIVASVILIAIEIKRSDDSLPHYYSNLSNRSLRPMGITFFASVFVSAMARLTESYATTHNIDVDWLLALSSAVLSATLCIFGILILRQKFFGACQKHEFDLCEDNAIDDSSERNRKRVRASLDTMMHTRMLYTKPDLDITELSLSLKVSCVWLANFIETTFGMTFFHCVNRHRITRAKILLAAPRGQNRDEVIDRAWREAGFTSRRQMYRMFKEFDLPVPR